MALIDCPECGKSVSDKAQKCVSCGHQFFEAEETNNLPESEIAEKNCPECGNKLFDENAESCPDCGCPIEYTEEELQIKEQKAAKAKKKRLGIIIGSSVAVVVVAILIGVFAIQANNAKQYDDYVVAYNQVVKDMLSGAADAESVVNTASKVWYAAINTKYKRSWDSDIADYYSTDFNTALANMYADSKYKTKVNNLKSNQETVKGEMQKIQGAPDDFKNAYSTINDMYEKYLKYTNLAISPSGSYTSFSSETKELSSDLIATLNKVKTQIPQEK